MKPTKHAFTLVELTIVIAVIGILVAILIPTFANVIEKANAKSALSDARNTVTQYVIDAFDDKSLPNDLVIIIKKAGKFYLFGYDTKGDGKLKISNDNPFKVNPAETKQVIKDLSWNFKKGDDVLPEDDGTDYSNYNEYGAFYLIPYDAEGEPTVEIKGFHPSKDDELETKYPSFKTRMSENMGEDSDVYHGILLPGTFAYDSDTITTSDTTEISVTPTPALKFTVTFDKGTLAGDENAIVPADQQLSIFIPASWASQCAYTHAANAEEWYVFDHFEKDGATIGASFAITEDTTITVVWKHMEAEKYRLTFDENNGTLDESTIPEGFTNGMQFLVNTDITSYINSIEAKRDNYTFGGWENISTHVQYTSENPASNVIITEDTTLKAIWNEVKYNVTIDPNGGISEGHTDSYLLNANGYSQGETMTLPTPTREGFNFTGWDSSVADEPTCGAGATYTMPGEDVTFTAKWESSSKTVMVKFYDTWNEQTISGDTATVSGSTVSYSQVQSLAPKYWVQGSTITVSITADNTVTFEGTRQATTTAAADNLTPTYTTYTGTGVMYQCITTTAGLKKVSSSLNGNYMMLNSIDFDATKVSIGHTDEVNYNPFTGIFDGGRFTVENYNCVLSTSSRTVGLFAENNGTIKNLVVGIDQVEGGQMIGGLCGINSGTLINCHVITTDRGTVGGIALDVTANFVGGLVGQNSSTGTIKLSSSNIETVYAYAFCVGFVASNYGTIDQCFSCTGANADYIDVILNPDDYTPSNLNAVGGFVVQTNGTITNCFVNLRNYVVGYDGVGGFAFGTYEGSKVQNCIVIHNDLLGSYCSGGAVATIYANNVDAETPCYVVSTGIQGTYLTGFMRVTDETLRYAELATTTWPTSIWNAGTTEQYPYLQGIVENKPSNVLMPVA